MYNPSDEFSFFCLPFESIHFGSYEKPTLVRDEYVGAIDRAHAVGIQIYGDIVLNHRLGADASEEFEATPLDPNNRFQPIDSLQKIEGWTNFTFPGRKGKYSTMEWHWWHFDAIDYNVDNQQQKAVYLIKDKTFDRNVDAEKGNFDYLMGCDLDMDHPRSTAPSASRLCLWYPA